MFNIGPLELLVLAGIGLMVFGPDKLPQLARDAGKILRTLRDVAQGARTTLGTELGTDLSKLDLANLNPRTAIRNAILGDDEDFAALNPKTMLTRAINGEPAKPVTPGGPTSGGATAGGATSAAPPAHGEQAPYDADTT